MEYDLIEHVEDVLSRLESVSDVAYAEVGGVSRDISEAIVSATTVRSTVDMTTAGVWWRVFVDGAADYRYTSELDDDHIEDLIERSVRSARLLDQSAPARYDRGRVHRATHPGWTSTETPPVDLPADDAARRIREALDGPLDGLDVDRVRASYRGERVDSVVTTTTDSAVDTTLDRSSIETVVALADGAKLRRHDGTTDGCILRALPDRLDSLAASARDIAGRERTTADPAGRRDVVLRPLATGSLIHQLSHYLELDSAYIGSSPVALGDQVAGDPVCIDDTIPAGSWAARAYDAEATPTQSVSLVADGVAVDRLYDRPGAIEEDAFPAGHLIPSLGYDDPPRIHARHLEMDAGDRSVSALRDGADIEVVRFGEPRLENEATRTKRASAMPPSVLYAKDIADSTPSEFDAESTEQAIRFPIREGYTLSDGDRDALIRDGVLSIALSDLLSIDALGTTRRTLTGTCEKHRSRLPFAATAPSARLTTSFESHR